MENNKVSAREMSTYNTVLYNRENVIGNGKVEQIVDLYRTVFSKPPWSYDPKWLTPQILRKEVGFFMSPGSAIVTAENGNVTGFRLVTDLDTISRASDPQVRSLIEYISGLTNVPKSQISFTHSAGVADKYTRNGVASEMMKLHFDYVARSGYKYVLGWTRDQHEVMFGIYTKNGYDKLSIPENLVVGIDLVEVGGIMKFVVDNHVSNPVFYLKDLARQ